MAESDDERIEGLEDKIDGLDSDLHHTLDLMVRVARGEQTVQAMGEWTSLNYPKLRERLPAIMQVTPP